ncbi:hypothetical protein BCR32DRAFT_267474 [Anaeromyces robustus]|uniref:FAR-17a/AIG1-like protein n=1 Tax=Anaeromyces robustus TaxID=1754192 RepID=A0A1Y1XAD3_9FUNG|nr:hypothetical protein BCR32DRAFT_267474 [Anaeromyces robustus]|eukprot:ORX82689.1 hypothetical protein BCR32DRAFT_267474 [Anaeromyces robustus]
MSFESFFVSDKFNLYQTITPFKGSKKGLFYFRLFALFIFTLGIPGSVYTTIHHNPKKQGWQWFCYFTNQTFVALYIYFLIGIINYLLDAKGKLNSKISNSFVHTIYHIFCNVLFPLAFIVTVIFWGLIFPTQETYYFTPIHWAENIIQHLLNSVFMGIDWYLVTIPTGYSHFIPMFVVGVAYLVYTQIYYYIYNIWVYPFLNRDTNKKWYILYSGLVIAWSFIGFVFAGIQKFKNRNRKLVSHKKLQDDIDLA